MIKSLVNWIAKKVGLTKLPLYLLTLLPHKKFNKISDGEFKTIYYLFSLFIQKIVRYNTSKIRIFRNVKFKFIHNFEMKLNINEYTQCGYYFGAPDKELIQLIRLGGGTFIDIGANVGIFSLIASQAFEKVLSFEPNPDTFSMLENNININKIKNIKSYNLGLSDQNSIMKLYLNPLNNGGASLSKFSAKLHEEYSAFSWNEAEVKVKTLDSVIEKEINSIDLMKIDIEGHELPALKGALGIIKLYKPLIFSEVSGDETKVKDILSLLPESYIAYSLIDKKIVSEKYIGKIPNDILFFPEEKSEILI